MKNFNSFDSSLNTYVLLRGNRGMGKTSAVTYALGKLIGEGKIARSEIIYVEIDALIFN